MATWRDEKKRYKQYKARQAELPASHQAAVDAVERYAIRFGPGAGEPLVPPSTEPPQTASEAERPS